MHLVCEDVGYNLQLLNYEERFCARRFRESFFGLLLSSSSSDLRTFWSFSDSTISMWQGLDMYGLVRPWAR